MYVSQMIRSKRALIWLITAAGLIILAASLFFIRKGYEKKLYDQRAYLSWSDRDAQAGQISVFYPYDARMDGFAQKELEYRVKTELIKESAIDEDGCPFFTCSSASGKVVLEHNGKSFEANAIGTEGDFFRFHPVKIVSGGTYSDDMLTPDRIMIDEDLAWQLFGAYEVSGQLISIGGVTHTIAGVFAIDRKSAIDKRAGIPDNLVFLSLYSLCQLGEVDGADGPSDNGTDAAAVGTAKLYGISTWEIVMPDPVKNFALNIIKEAVGEKSSAQIVYNSKRYEPEYLGKNTGFILTGGMQTRPYAYPYWENIALGWANIFTIMWYVQIISTVIAIIILSVFAMILWKHRSWTFSGLWNRLMDKKYEMESRMRNTQKKWKYF